MKKLLFLTVPLLLAGSVAFIPKNADVNYADTELRQYAYSDIPNNGTLSGAYSQFVDIADVTSYLGYGYNVIESRYINKYDVLKTNPIFNIEQLSNTNLLLDRENSLYARSYKESTMQDFSETYNANLTINGSYGPFFSGGLKLDFAWNNNAKSYYYFYKGVVSLKTFTLTMSAQNSDLRNMLASEFEYDLNNMQPALLFGKYGTHFIKDVTMGGRLELNTTFSSDSLSITSDTQTAVDARIEYMNFALGMGGSASSSSTLSQYHVVENQNVFCVGGPQLPMTGAANVKTYLNQWINSFNTDLSYSALVDVPNYQSLVPLWELLSPSNQARRNQLETYFNSAVSGSNSDLYSRFTTYDIYQVSISASEGGSVDASQLAYKAGSLATVTATPSIGYEFSGWYRGGTRVSSSQTYSFTIQENTNLEARFIKRITMEGKGTSEEPFIVTNRTQLSQIRYAMSAHYKLGNDITFESGLFTPIPGIFTGELDGNGKTIKNMKIDKTYSSGSSTGYLGLFEKIGARGVVKNLHINESTLNARQSSNNSSMVYCGLVCGMNNGGTIINVDYFKSSVIVEHKISLVGGIAGYSTGEINSCDLLGCIVSGPDVVGGIVGSADYLSETIDCSFDAETFFGWFAVTPGQIKLVAKNVSNSFVAGGIVGYCYRATVSGCSVRFTNFNIEGTITRNPTMGYVVGHLSGGSIDYETNDFRNNTTQNINSSYRKYYFAKANGYVGRTENNPTINGQEY